MVVACQTTDRKKERRKGIGKGKKIWCEMQGKSCGKIVSFQRELKKRTNGKKLKGRQKNRNENGREN